MRGPQSAGKAAQTRLIARPGAGDMAGGEKPADSGSPQQDRVNPGMDGGAAQAGTDDVSPTQSSFRYTAASGAPLRRFETTVYHRSLFLDGPAGRLEALLWTSPRPDTPLAALVCHPHPLYGGTMHNKVVFQVARTLHGFGVPVLRFNFRGAGLSEGVHDLGRGEQDDVRAAVDFLAKEFPQRPLLLAGFSFGAWVGLRVGCADRRVSELVGLGLPTNSSDLSYLRGCAKPKLLLQGDRDQYGSRENVEALIAGMPESERRQTTLVFIPADHFFAGKLDQVHAALAAWLHDRHPKLAPSLDETRN